MSLLELDPNIVKPGWTPLLILVGLALVMALLFRSMRRQFRRVDDHWPDAAAEAAARRGITRTESTDRNEGTDRSEGSDPALPDGRGVPPSDPVDERTRRG